MPPLTRHAVYTPDDTLCFGYHFLNFNYLQQTIRGIHRHYTHTDEVNEEMPVTVIYLCCMAISLASKKFRDSIDLSKLPKKRCRIESRVLTLPSRQMFR